MRAKGKQLLSFIFIFVFIVLFYMFYADKLTFQFSKDVDKKQHHLGFQYKLSAENTVGKVITRSRNGWTIDHAICKTNNDFVLAHLKNPPNTPIFVYSAKEDVWVSGNIIANGAWEGGHVDTILIKMKQFPNSVFMDIGANVGMFSVSVAAHGYRVIAVDCLASNIMRLCATMKAAKLTDRLTIVYNALSHTHEKVSLGKHKGNVGGTHVKQGVYSDEDSVNTMFLDDLLEIYTFDQVVMKMDVETFEANVLKGAYQFFKEVKVEALLIEFVAHKDKESGKFIADFLASHGMEPKVPDNIKDDYTKWGNDVLFLRKSKPAYEKSEIKTMERQTEDIITVSNSEQAFGRVISYSGNKWTSGGNFCPKDTSRFVSAKLGHPYNIPIFVYTEKEDKWISGRIINGGVWEEDLVNKILIEIDNHPRAVFLDIGSNIGVFSMAVASRGRKVISIDCLRGNVERLCNSVKAAGFTDRVSIIKNALSSDRTSFSLGTYKGNVGGTYLKKSWEGSDIVSSILLDDLLTLFPLEEVVIKMDVETHEASVLQGAVNFFKEVKVHYLLLEFVAHKAKPSGTYIRNFFVKNEMKPILPSTANFDDTSTWPNEVAFRRKTNVNIQREETITKRSKENKKDTSYMNLLTTETETTGKVITRSSFVDQWREANVSCVVKKNFVRANLNRDPNTPIFVYSQTEDKWVSGSIIMHGSWEGDLVNQITTLFREFPDATFLDIGANVGMFSLSVAKLGKRVISFDCLTGNVERLCASMRNNPGFGQRMTIVYNALSNQREKVTLGTYSGNIGGTYVKKIDSNANNVNIVDSIFLDDVLEIFKLDTVIMKMDVETFEAKVLEGAEKFFSTVKVEALLMEFVSHKGKQSGEYILQFLEKHNLFPVLRPGMDKLDTKTWKKGEVMFRRGKSKS